MPTRRGGAWCAASLLIFTCSCLPEVQCARQRQARGQFRELTDSWGIFRSASKEPINSESSSSYAERATQFMDAFIGEEMRRGLLEAARGESQLKRMWRVLTATNLDSSRAVQNEERQRAKAKGRAPPAGDDAVNKPVATSRRVDAMLAKAFGAVDSRPAAMPPSSFPLPSPAGISKGGDRRLQSDPSPGASSSPNGSSRGSPTPRSILDFTSVPTAIYRIINSSLPCSGVGIPLNSDPAAAATTTSTITSASPSSSASPLPVPILAYQCGGSNVTSGLYSGVTGIQSGGATGGNVGPLSGTLVAAPAVNASSAANATAPASQLGQIVNQTSPLPSGWQSSLSLPQQLGLQTVLGVPSLVNVTTNGDLFPGPQPGRLRAPAQEAAILTLLPPPVVESVLSNATLTCDSQVVGYAPAANATGTAGGGATAASQCACPIDYSGPQCQWPRHMACTVTIADPLYQACASMNGHGFQPPTREAGARFMASLSSLGGSGSDVNASAVSVSRADDDDQASYFTLLGAQWDGQAIASYGPGSGVAVPVGLTSALGDLQAYAGAVREDAAEAARRMPRPTAGTAAYGRYRTDLPGDPPCLFLNLSHMQGSAGGSSSSSGSRVVHLALRVSCAFAERPGTARLTSGVVTVDPTGTPYGDRADADGLIDVMASAGVTSADNDVGASDNSLTGLTDGDAVAVLQAGAARSPVFVAGMGQAAWKCNGTAITPALLQAQLPLRGYAYSFSNGSSLPPLLPLPSDPWPHLTSLACKEAAFTYVLGGPGSGELEAEAASAIAAASATAPLGPEDAADVAYLTSLLHASRAAQPFALSQPPLLPLALRLRPLSPTILSATTGTVLVPLPLEALDGSIDVTVPLDVGSTVDDVAAGMWAGGRLQLEATVVQTAEGIAVGPWAEAERQRLGQEGPQADPAVGPRPALPLPLVAGLLYAAGDVTTYTASPSPDASSSSAAAAAAPVVLPGSLLLTTGIARITIDDVSWVEPTAKDWTALVLGIGLGLGIPLVLGVILLVLWLRRLAAARSAAETRALLKAMKDGDAAVRRRSVATAPGSSDSSTSSNGSSGSAASSAVSSSSSSCANDNGAHLRNVGDGNDQVTKLEDGQSAHTMQTRTTDAPMATTIRRRHHSDIST